MTPATARVLVRRVGPDPELPADAELVGRFARTADPAAFADLVRRHGPMVLAACRRLLPSSADADDAFQAVFVVLLRRAGAVRPAGAVGGWLHGVAVRTAQKARVAAARRRRREMTNVLASPATPEAYAPGSAEHAELCAVLDEELAKLPEPMRAAVVLCDLAGKTRAEAAADLGCPEGTVAARVFRARKVLAERLTRRGVTAPAAVAAAAVPAELFAAVAGFAHGGSIPSAVRALADDVVRGMVAQPLSLAFAAVAAVAVAAGALWAAGTSSPEAAAVPAADPAPPAEGRSAPGLVTSLGFAPDGKRYLVVACGKAVVKDAATDRVLWDAPAEAARFTADGAAVMTLDKEVVRREAATGKALKTTPRGKSEFWWHVAAFSADGTRYAAHDGFRARLYDTATGAEPVRLLPEHGGLPGGVLLRSGGKDVLVSPDGKLVAAVGVLLTANEVGAAVWDADTGKRLLAFPPPGDLGEWVSATAAAFSPDGKTLAVATEKRVHLFDTAGFKHGGTLPDTPGSGTVTALAFAPDGKSIAVGYRLPLLNGADKEPRVVGRKTEVQVIELALLTELRRFDGFEGVSHMGPTRLPVTALAFAPDGKTLLAGTGLSATEPTPPAPLPPGEVKRFVLADPPAKAAAPTWREKGKLPPFEDRVHSVAFSPDGKQLAVGGRGGRVGPVPHTVTMWDAATRRQLWAGGPFPAGTTGVSFSADGKLLAATRDKTTGLYIPGSGQSVLMNPPLPGGKATAFSHAEERVAGQARRKLAITDGRMVAVLDWAEGVPVSSATFGPLKDGPKVEGELPAGVAFAPSGRQLVFIPNHKVDPAYFAGKAAAAGPATHWVAHVWGGGSGAPMYPLPHGTAPVTAVAWSPDGKQVASGCRLGDVVIWDAATFKELRRTRLGGRGGEGEIRALAFAPDGKTLAAAVSFDEGKNAERVVMLDPTTGERLGNDLQGFGTFTPVSLAFAPNGLTLAVGLADFLPLAQLNQGGEPRPLGSVVLFTTDPEPKAAPPAPALPEDVSFAPNGKTYLFVSGGRAQLANAATDRVLWDAPADAARFSPDGKTVLTLTDAAARRDAATGKLLKEVRMMPNSHPVRAAAFSPDGKLYAVHHGTFAQVLDGAGGFERARLGPDPILPQQVLPPGAVARLAWSPDGKQLAVVGLPKQGGGVGVTLWDGAGRGGELGGFPAAEARAAAFSPDGKTLAVATPSGVYLWADGAKVPRREALLGDLGAIGFLPDGRLVTAGEGRFADGKSSGADTVYERRLFAHVVDRKQTFGGYAAIDMKIVRPAGAPPVTALAVDPDGRSVLVSAGGGVTRLTFTTMPRP